MASIYQEVNHVFVKAFSLNDLKQLSRFYLNKELEEITGTQNLREAVFEVTKWARRQGLMKGLIEGAQEYSSNPEVHALSWDVPDRRRPGEALSSKDFRVDDLTIELSLRMKQLEESVDRLSRILTGADGYNGVRAVSVENSRKLEMLQKAVRELKVQVGEIRRNQDEGPKVFESREATIAFGVIIALLVILIGLYAAGTFGWISVA